VREADGALEHVGRRLQLLAALQQLLPVAQWVQVCERKKSDKLARYRLCGTRLGNKSTRHLQHIKYYLSASSSFSMRFLLLSSSRMCATMLYTSHTQ
jgi:hypothetical protein